jgi:hypothetical protein
MTWDPVLSRQSDLGAHAWEVIEAIADALRDKSYDVGVERSFSQIYEGALLYSYLAIALDDLEWANRAAERLNQAIDNTAQSAGFLGLFGGLTGLGWTVEHVSHLLRRLSATSDDLESEAASDPDQNEDEEDPNVDLDAAILRDLDNTSFVRQYDLISGLVGFGTYFLERLPRDSAVRGARAVFGQLEDRAERGNGTATWHSGPELLPGWQREQSPNGYYNLGVAHGIPGVIHFLSELSTTEIVDPARSHELLEGAVNWLLAQQRPIGSVSRFSGWISDAEESTDSRMSWCYGDLGILAVMMQVVRRTGQRSWRTFTEELLDHCLARSLDPTVADAPLCHGAIGVAHIFRRIYQTEGDRRCLDAAILWYERAMAFRRPGTGIGGFFRRTIPHRSAPPVWEASPAFIDGAVGVALAFLAAVTPLEPCWDRMLLLSGRDLNGANMPNEFSKGQ